MVPDRQATVDARGLTAHPRLNEWLLCLVKVGRLEIRFVLDTRRNKLDLGAEVAIVACKVEPCAAAHELVNIVKPG